MPSAANAATAWSPIANESNMFALGTAESELHLVYFDLIRQDIPPNVIGRVPTAAPFRTLAWSPATRHQNAHPWGVIAGGLEDGTVAIWDPTQISSGQVQALSTVSKHNGPVTALQFNPIKESSHLLASGGADGNVWIISLNNLAAPGVFSPGTATPGTEITSISWNTTAAYILAAGSLDGRVTVWDLKQKKVCFEVHEYGPVKALAWSPEEGFLLMTASLHFPVIHIWDLRASNTVPLVELHGHHVGGIVSAAWCPHGSGIVVSTGTDNRTLLWDLKTREMIHDVSNHGAPRAHLQFSHQPGYVSSTTADGSVQVIHIRSGAASRVLRWNPHKVAEPAQTLPPNSTNAAPIPDPAAPAPIPPMAPVPSVTAEAPVANPASVPEPLVAISPEVLIASAVALEETTPEDFCDWKLAQSGLSDADRQTWSFLKVLFEPDARKQLLVHLGFDEFTGGALLLPRGDDAVVESGPLPVFTAASETAIKRSLLVGNFEAAVDICLEKNQLANALLLATCGGPELWHRTQEAFFQRQTRPFMKIVAAVIKNELDSLVQESDPTAWKETLSILSTYSKSDEFPGLCDQLAWRLLDVGDVFSASLCFICAMNMDKTVEIWSAIAPPTSDAALQGLVEKIHVLAQGTGQSADWYSPFYSQYATLMATLGKKNIALKYAKGDQAVLEHFKSPKLEPVKHASPSLDDVNPFDYKKVPNIPHEKPSLISPPPPEAHVDPSSTHEQTAYGYNSPPQEQTPYGYAFPAQEQAPFGYTPEPEPTPSSQEYQPSITHDFGHDQQPQYDSFAGHPAKELDESPPPVVETTPPLSSSSAPVSLFKAAAPTPPPATPPAPLPPMEKVPFVRTPAMHNIPDDDIVIVETLVELLSLLELQKLTSAETKQLAEAAKAKDVLVTKLDTGDLSPTVLQSVHDMTQALQRRDFKAAQQVHVALTSSHWALQKEWLRGLKAFFQLCTKRLK
ncbi:unnamed protein product [Aphanomyces euteiches]|nr:hypothetical protein AeRB84_003300 [Aphanomyces euteiches]